MRKFGVHNISLLAIHLDYRTRDTN